MIRRTTLYLGMAGVFLSAAALAAAPKPKPAAKKPPKPAAVITPTSTAGAYLLVELSADDNDNFAKPIGQAPLQVGQVPFQLPQGEHDHLCLRQAQWNGWQQDLPWSHESPGPTTPHDPSMPILRVPVADYVAAHVLAIADDDPGLVPVFTLCMGSVPRNGNEQCVQFDFAGRVPRRNAAIPHQDVAVETAGENLYYVRVPTTFAFAQDLAPEKPLAIELTKEIRLARRSPDPCRFRYRPLGLSSGVRLAALTLEKSPLQMRVSSDQTGHAFVEPQTPTFRISLTNILPTAQAYALSLQAVPLQGTKVVAERTGRVAAGATAGISVPLAVGKRGYYDLTVTLTDGKQRMLLRRETSFALLPPDTRQHRDQSPFGTYDYGGAHFTCPDPDKIGPLFVKLGMRYGLFSDRALEARRAYGLLKGNEPNITNQNATK